MTRVLLIAEHDNSHLNVSTARALACAKEIGPTDVAVLGNGIDGVAGAAARLDGVARVLTVDHDANGAPLAVVLASQIVALSPDYTHVLMPSTTFGKDVLPRAAALLGVPQVSDLMEVIDGHTFKRPTYAGNVITTVSVPADCKVLATVRTASFQAVGESGSEAAVEAVAVTPDATEETRWIGLATSGGERPDLQSAPRVVSGGRGVGSEDAFKVIYSLADKLGAAAGASRAAVDAGYVPNDMQVGQTGKIIAPDLYIAVGISGAIQHITGIKDAGTIVAINKDADAPIFEVADIGLVGDLFTLLPELEAALGGD